MRERQYKPGYMHMPLYRLTLFSPLSCGRERGNLELCKFIWKIFWHFLSVRKCLQYDGGALESASKCWSSGTHIIQTPHTCTARNHLPTERIEISRAFFRTVTLLKFCWKVLAQHCKCTIPEPRGPGIVRARMSSSRFASVICNSIAYKTLTLNRTHSHHFNL